MSSWSASLALIQKLHLFRVCSESKIWKSSGSSVTVWPIKFMKIRKFHAEESFARSCHPLAIRHNALIAILPIPNTFREPQRIHSMQRLNSTWFHRHLTSCRPTNHDWNAFAELQVLHASRPWKQSFWIWRHNRIGFKFWTNVCLAKMHSWEQVVMLTCFHRNYT